MGTEWQKALQDIEYVQGKVDELDSALNDARDAMDEIQVVLARAMEAMKAAQK